MSKTTTLQPHVSEKSYSLSAAGVYVFQVDKSTNKHTVARAVEAQFDVTVETVNTLNNTGKAKRIISISGKRQKNGSGKRSDVKKAYVTLSKGQSLPFFAEVEAAAKEEQETQEKIDKAAAKQSDKDAKPARRGLLRPKKTPKEEA